MGAGKSTIGKELSDRMGIPLYETDTIITVSSGRTIDFFFETNEVKQFRQLETNALLSTPDNSIVSTGGGIVESEFNRAFLKKKENFIIWLDSEPLKLLKRIVKSDRPLVRNLTREELLELYYKRYNLYKSCADLEIREDDEQIVAAMIEKEVCMDKAIKIKVLPNIGKELEIKLNEPKRIYEIFQMLDMDSSDYLSFKLNNSAYVDERKVIYKDTTIECISICHPEGRWIYQDTAIFVMSKAFHNLFPNSSFFVEHSVGNAVYCEVFEKENGFNSDDVENLKREMLHIVSRSMDIIQVPVFLKEAEKIFEEQNRKDFLKNLNYFSPREVKLYRCGSYYDYYLRTLADNTRVLTKFDLRHQKNGFLLIFNNCSDSEFILPEKLFKTHQEHDKWLNILKVHNIRDLNKLIDSYDISHFILVEEALHEKKIALIADRITKDERIKIILIAGPSSSGKTTFAKRLSVQLRVCGVSPFVISMDDYFLARTQTPRKEDGSFDFECIESLDLPLLNDHLQKLIDGEEIELPKYNFSSGVSERSFQKVKLGPNNVIVMEGIHGINDKLTESIPAENKVKIYISALNQLNIDDHNRIPTTDCRKIRRMVRDKLYRGYSAEDTLQRWQDVRDGEDKNIFPFQENANFMFNSSLTYELAVLKKYAVKVLRNVPTQSPVYTEALRLLDLLSFVKDIPEELVPANSLLKEFISGSIFRE